MLTERDGKHLAFKKHSTTCSVQFSNPNLTFEMIIYYRYSVKTKCINVCHNGINFCCKWKLHGHNTQKYKKKMNNTAWSNFILQYYHIHKYISQLWYIYCVIQQTTDVLRLKKIKGFCNST